MTGATGLRSTLLAGLGGAWSRRCAAGLTALTLVACVGTPANQTTGAQSDERRLFAETDQSILEYHIKQVEPQQLALTGLARLHAIDPQVSIADAPGVMTLQVGDKKRS